jgi:hypothetical protein
MSMPETAIDKHSEFLASEHEVRLTKYARVSPPARNPVFSKQRDHPEFSIAIVLPTDLCHHRTPFSRSENVRHD